MIRIWRGALTMAASMLVVATVARATLPVPRLLGYACRPDAAHCTQRALFKPHSFQLGSHYWFTNVIWKSWNPWTASAIVTLHARFAGPPPDRPTADRTLVIFSRPKTLCGVLTFSQWVSGDGNAGTARRAPGSAMCLFFVA